MKNLNESSFRHVYNLGYPWFKRYADKYLYSGIYDYNVDKANYIWTVYDKNGDHILTYMAKEGKVFTDISYNKICEDAMGGVSAPMSTPLNTPGMGNVTPSGVGAIGSGDKFDTSINKKLYTQSGKKKKKKDMRRVTKVNEELQAKFYHRNKNMIDVYRIDIYPILKASRNKVLFDKLIKDLNLKSDKYMGVVWSNLDHSISIDVEESTYIPMFFNEDKVNIISKLLGEKIHLVKSIDENNINPRDKIGMAMAKHMKINPPFKKKKDKGNQNAIKQQKFEHQIITLDNFVKELNESRGINWHDIKPGDIIDYIKPGTSNVLLTGTVKDKGSTRTEDFVILTNGLNIFMSNVGRVHKKLDEKSKVNESHGLQLNYGNTYWEVLMPFFVYVQTGRKPSNAYYGASQIYQGVYEKIELEEGDQIHALVGGTFVVKKNGRVYTGAYLNEPEFRPFEHGNHDYDNWEDYIGDNLQQITDESKINKPKTYR